MILHTVNKSPYASQCLADCLNRVASGDAVILIEDGVYGTNFANSPDLISLKETILKLLEFPVKFYALQADVEARGLNHSPQSRLPQEAHYQLIDDSGFVDLVIRADKVLSWY